MTNNEKLPKSNTGEPSNEEGETDFTKDPLKAKIGNSLRQLYDDVVNEPVPDDFLSLLAKADDKSQ